MSRPVLQQAQPTCRSGRRGFSLLELLIVIAIIALLMAVTVPVLKKARGQAHLIVCANRLRQWGLALQYYRGDFQDYIPTEGHLGLGGHMKPNTWYNELPPYLNAPRYKDIDGVNEHIAELPALNVWVCPAKNLTDAYKSQSGQNQFHYGMNQVLDGMGEYPYGSSTTPYFPDMGETPLRASRFDDKPTTVYMFDIDWNAPAGSPRHVATEFHRGSANVLLLSGYVARVGPHDIVEGGDFQDGEIIWDHRLLYWGYPPPPPWKPSWP